MQKDVEDWTIAECISYIIAEAEFVQHLPKTGIIEYMMARKPLELLETTKKLRLMKTPMTV